eukprot:CAMPEP_0172603686 /NCGR_PEP_ID=MMETSP1068-20121228/23938_1 /TAXON_ID=35684 /ORGANISM="Pseudopedinella elastica, Strain CCMP716" /LENGTH=129 /DNA_ID=CAMNT_0013405511 /DNA_START=104 /DNA_END=493 /DNA_ORIENTATION=-
MSVPLPSSNHHGLNLDLPATPPPISLDEKTKRCIRAPGRSHELPPSDLELLKKLSRPLADMNEEEMRKLKLGSSTFSSSGSAFDLYQSNSQFDPSTSSSLSSLASLESARSLQGCDYIDFGIRRNKRQK